DSSNGNAILSNSISGNDRQGIDLGDNGLTVNDLGDSDTGANNFQNFPELTSASSSDGNTTIKGKINSTPNTTFRVEFFSNKVLDDSGFGGGDFGSGGFGGGGFGEGEKFLGFQDVTTDSSGNATVAINLPLVVPIGQFITATATDPNNNTSEFSKNLEVKTNSEPQLQWVRQMGTSLYEVGRDTATDSAGNVYMVGYTGENDDLTFGNLDTLFIKYDSNGNKLWQKQLTDPATDAALGVKIDAANNVYLVGYTNTSSNADAYIYKYDSNGNEIWKKVFSSQVTFADPGDYATGVDLDNSGNIYVAGNTWGSFDPAKAWPRIPNQNAFITKYDTNGNQIWIKDFGTDQDENVRAITTDNAGNSYIVGQTSGSLGVRVDGVDAFIAKYDTNGNQVWLRQFGTVASDVAYGVKLDSAGSIYVTGSTRGNLNGNNNSGGADSFVVKYDSNGNQLWTNQFGTVGSENIPGVSLDKNGNIYVAGMTEGSLDGSTNAGNYDIFVTKLDSSGVRSWSQQLGTAGEDSTYKLFIDDANNIYITGSASGSLEGQPYAGSSDAVLLKYKIG
ncbi:MAG: hypothetical protein HC941_29725, partial [Microcoleus sp. SU_5_3]|nr:hypothetical protein [Microcoleus sp. SU_5_3]